LTFFGLQHQFVVLQQHCQRCGSFLRVQQSFDGKVAIPTFKITERLCQRDGGVV
jgi:hypothetical protein